MKLKQITVSLMGFVFLLSTACQMPSTPQETVKLSNTFDVVLEVPLSPETRGLFVDGAVSSISVKVTDATDTVVGSGTLSKGATSWNGFISLTATGSLTFSVRALNATSAPLYGGVVTQTVTGATSITIPVLAKVIQGGSIQNVPLDLTKTVSSLAGFGTQFADGTGTAARFNTQQGITSDGTNLYVADTINQTIRKVVISTGVVSTLAGLAGSIGSSDGTGTAARFNSPYGITVDGANLYVADKFNHTIRKVVIATGAVSTLAGMAGTSGSTDGTGGSARFNNPTGIANDGTNLYVTDESSYTIRKMVIATGVVTTLAGLAGSQGVSDGIGSAARFKAPRGISSDGTNLFVADAWSHTIRKVVIATGEVTTLVGLAGSSGSSDGTGSAARFNNQNDVTNDGTNLYVVDTVNHTIRKVVIATGVVTTLAGLALSNGSGDGTGNAARFNYPSGITMDGASLYISDTANNTIRRIVISTEVVTTLAGLAFTAGSSDGTGTVARFNEPYSLTSDGVSLYVADSSNHTIRKVEISTGVVTTLAGLAGTSGSSDGTGGSARFYKPSAITCDGSNLYVADTFNHAIRKVVISTGAVTTLAGLVGSNGSTDGTGTAAKFNYPGGITCVETNLYVTDQLSHTIRKIEIATGVVTTLAGTVGVSGGIDGGAMVATFNNPFGLTSDGAHLFVADYSSNTIRKVVIATGVVSTLAGSSGSSGSTDGSGGIARFYNPKNITNDGTNLYVVDTKNHSVRKIVIATGVVTTLAGIAGSYGAIEGAGTMARFYYPAGITTDGTSLYVADSTNHTIRKIE